VKLLIPIVHRDGILHIIIYSKVFLVAGLDTERN